VSSVVIGLDVGGTKTAAALATRDGQVLATSLSGPGNYQAIGLDAAAEVYAQALRPLRALIERDGHRLEASAFGLCGLDRAVDAERLSTIITPLIKGARPPLLVNDTALVLRAGTPDGVGVALVSGTGSNCLGRGPSGDEARIGGFGHDFGDDGSAEDIGRAGVRAVFRAEDGRGAPTSLRRLLFEHYALSELHDFVDRFLVDAPGGQASLGEIAPLVFQAALAGDTCAHQIVVEAGEELAHSALVVTRRLFAEGDPVPFVLGGSVWQRAKGDAMRDAFMSRVKRTFAAARISTLSGPPVLGALLLALDQVDALDTQSVALRERLLEGLEARE